jgi:hypothetical protein
VNTEIEEALDLLYKGQTNVAVKAKQLEIPLPQLKQLLNHYISQNPISSDAWNADIELGWPYIT